MCFLKAFLIICINSKGKLWPIFGFSNVIKEQLLAGRTDYLGLTNTAIQFVMILNSYHNFYNKLYGFGPQPEDPEAMVPTVHCNV